MPPSLPRTTAGTSAATCATGQWCWQSCSPPPAARRGCSPMAPTRHSHRPTVPPPATLTRSDSARRLERPLIPALQLGDLLPGELGNGATARPLGQEPQRASRQVVVGVLERAPASVGDREQPGRPATAPAAVRPAVLASTIPSASKLSRWRRTAAGVRPSRADRPEAVTGPFSRMSRAILPRVPGSEPRPLTACCAPTTRPFRLRRAGTGTAFAAAPRGVLRAASTGPTFFTTSLCRN